MTRIELVTSSLPRKRSTTELHRLKWVANFRLHKYRTAKKHSSISQSERPGSNRRHSAWKADALPTELLSHFGLQRNHLFTFKTNKKLVFFGGGESRIRTCEVKNNGVTVRPRWPLEYLPFISKKATNNIQQMPFSLITKFQKVLRLLTLIEPMEGLEPTTC